MKTNPYKVQPSRAFWSRSVSEEFNAVDVVSGKDAILKKRDKVVSAGSCFASNLVPYIESAGLTYIRTEQLPEIFGNLGENLGYANFSAAYGNIYTARQLLQLYLRSLGSFSPLEDYWKTTEGVIDPFRPGLKYPAKSFEEFKLMSKSHLEATRKAFESADVFVFTLGLTEAWVNKLDGSVYPSCPGTIAGEFDPNKYEFYNFSVSEIIADMTVFIETLRSHNSKVRFILSVSPVPLVATATPNHVLRATTYSKSVLRVAAEELSNNFNYVDYFPAYELVTGPQAPSDFFESDRRNVSKQAVELVMAALLKSNGLKSSLIETSNLKKDSIEKNKIQEMSKHIAQVECDEVMLDENLI